MRINTNVSALNAWRNLQVTDGALSKSLERLSSGFRINRAADDAAGLAVSEKMRGQIRGLNQAVRNSQDGISLLQTAEGALTETHSILQRMRELAVQSSNGTLEDADRTKLNEEFTQLKNEIDRIAGKTQFNTKVLLDGTQSAGITFQVGPNAAETIGVTIGAMDATALAVTANTIDTSANATAAITAVDTAIGTVSSERSKLGAVQNRLEHTVANLSVAAENLLSAESRIRDADMALEMSSFTRGQILLQAGTAMLAQANAKTQSVLNLLR